MTVPTWLGCKKESAFAADEIKNDAAWLIHTNAFRFEIVR
jgi:hypothetical protein